MRSSSTSRLTITINPISLIEPPEKTTSDYFKSVVIHALAHMYERFKSIAFDLHPKTWLWAANIELPELPECTDDLPF